jgi:hypothetical protein
MFIIGLIPIVGAIIQNIIQLLDMLISALCAVFGWDQEAEGDTDPYNDAGDWLCGGIEGFVSTLLAWLIYAGNVMVDLSADGRLTFDHLNANELVDPSKGMTEGNSLMVGVVLSNTIKLIDLPPNIGGAYWYEYSDENLRSSTFAYQVQTTEADLHDDLSRNSMKDQWKWIDGSQGAWDGGHTYHIAEPVGISVAVPAVPVLLPAAGINRTLQVTLTEGYAIPVQNCYVGVCVVETTKDSNHFPLSGSLIFDVFPATLDGFYDLKALPDGGYALSWGQEGDIKFGRMLDMDGDGLPSTVDPNDSLWDSDLDGLGDGYELQIGSSPTNPDSDGDGLGDYQEVLAGTDPNRKDTDGDGLWDSQEVYHQDIFDQNGNGDTTEWVGGWMFYYQVNADGTRSGTWVTSNPLVVDADGDGLTDAQEKLYGFNPNVWSNAKVLTLRLRSVQAFDTQVQEQVDGGYVQSDGFVKPSDTLHYSATVKNELLTSYMQGLLSTSFPPAQDAGTMLPQSFILQPTQEKTISGTVGVSASAATGVYSLTQSAGALITDWSVLSKGAKLWLPMDDPTTADRSGSFPPNDATCTSSCPSVTGGRYGNALSLNGSSYLSSPADPNETQYAVSLWFKLALSEAEVTSQANGTLFAVNDAHGTQVYLSGGKVCADVYYTSSPETRCSTATSFNDNTWHHVVHTFGSVVGSQKLYVDGVQVASGTATGSAMANTNGVFVGHSTLAGRVNFNGLLDDVRLYDSALTAAQVRGLFNRPVFDMKFENPATTASGYQWTDTSIFGITGQCTGSHCPTSTTGIAGQGVQFDGSNKYISVGDNSNLDLSEGHFTIAAWIKPGTTSADTAPCLEYAYEGINMICVAFQPEGILGWKSGTGDAYATLQRQTIYHMDADPYLTGLYDRVRFGFATTSGWMGYYESPYGVLNAGAWNHVALTFGDGMVKLYVNGELKDTNTAVFAGKTPSVTKRLEIGASSRDGKVTFSSVDVWHEHDPGSAELCMACGGTQIFNGDVNGDNTYSINAQCPFTDEATLQIWENDSDPKCGSAANGDDQAIASHTFKITDGGMPTNPPVVCTTPFYSCTCPDAECLSFDGDVMGYVHFQYKHDSLPYRGTVDEVQIYRQVLDGESIKNLYRSLNTALRPFGRLRAGSAAGRSAR